MGIASLYTCKYDITTQLRVMNNCSGANKYMMQTVVDYPPSLPSPACYAHCLCYSEQLEIWCLLSIDLAKKSRILNIDLIHTRDDVERESDEERRGTGERKRRC